MSYSTIFKYIPLTFLVLCITITSSTFAQSEAQKTYIQGAITDGSTKEISIVIDPNPLLTNKVTIKSAIDEQGAFAIQFDLGMPVPATLEYGRVSIDMYIEPGDSIIVTGQAKQLKNNIKFSGKGGKHNNYFVAAKKQFDNRAMVYNRRAQVQNLDFKAYRSFVDSLRNEKMKLLNNFNANNADVSDSFKAFATILIQYPWATALLQYPNNHARYNRKKTIDVPQEYFGFLNDFSIINESAMLIKPYLTFLDEYTNTLFSFNVINKTPKYDYDSLYVQKLAFAEDVLQGKPMHYIKTKAFVEGCLQGRVELIIDKYEQLLEENPYADYDQVLQIVYEQSKHLSAGAEAPDFTVFSPEGEEVKLSDFKGNVVYVDFWATWCGPCKKQVPFAKELKKKFKGKDVVFLYVSFDKNEEQWQNYIVEKGMTGVQTIANANKPLISKTYRVQGIPKYLLIDKDGKIYSSKAKRPSQEGIEQDILSLLEKK